MVKKIRGRKQKMVFLLACVCVCGGVVSLPVSWDSTLTGRREKVHNDHKPLNQNYYFKTSFAYGGVFLLSLV